MAYKHNYIPYNCDIILIHEFHALTYPFPHKSSHSFHQFQAPNTWTFWSISRRPGIVFTVPKQSKWAIHGQPTPPTSVPLGGTEFPWPIHTKPNLMHNYQHKQPNQFMDCHGQSKNSPKIPTIWSQVLELIKRPLTTSNQLKHYKTLK